MTFFGYIIVKKSKLTRAIQTADRVREAGKWLRPYKGLAELFYYFGGGGSSTLNDRSRQSIVNSIWPDK